MKETGFDEDLKRLPQTFINMPVLILTVLESGFHGTLIWECYEFPNIKLLIFYFMASRTIVLISMNVF